MKTKNKNCGVSADQTTQKCISSGKNELILKKHNLSSLPDCIFTPVLYETITELDLTRNNIQTLPMELRHFKKLRSLYLTHNQIKMFPRELCSSFNQLEQLYLSFNPIERIPDEICEMNSLEELALDHCPKLKRLPESLSKCEKLQWLVLENNDMGPDGIPDCLLKSTELCILHKMEGMQEIVKGLLYLGGMGAEMNEQLLMKHKISHILCVADSKMLRSFPEKFQYKCVDLLDNEKQDINTVLGECLGFIDEANRTQGKVLVHCCAGISRSSLIAIAYIVKTEKKTFEEAFYQVRKIRPCALPNRSFQKQLCQWSLQQR